MMRRNGNNSGWARKRKKEIFNCHE